MCVDPAVLGSPRALLYTVTQHPQHGLARDGTQTWRQRTKFHTGKQNIQILVCLAAELVKGTAWVPV